MTTLSPVPDRADPPAPAAWYLLFVLTFAYTTSFIDRQVLNLLVGPIKADFDLTDTRMSVLQGAAFAIAYIAMGPVFGRLADRVNRRMVLMGGIAAWSIGTVLCGFSRNYTELFLARVLIGAAEASLTPAAWSMITDSFSPRRLPRAFSIYLLGLYMGSGLALVLGGWLLAVVSGWDMSGVLGLAGQAPWQLVFVVIGLVGALAAVLLAFVREPARRNESGTAVPDVPMPLAEIRDIFIARRRFYGNFFVGIACLAICLYGYPAWTPVFLMRRFGMSMTDIGLQYGALMLVSGSLGVLSGPWLSRLFTRTQGEFGFLLYPAVAAALLVPVSAMLYFTSAFWLALVLTTIACFLYSSPMALAASALQLATPNRMRGIATALYVFTANIVGLGAAPTIIAVMTDQVFADEARVGESMTLVCGVAAALAALLLWRAHLAFRTLMTPAAAA
ncbi:spinster family MFS transporter [Polymorphobacter sp.]|uniref:spinster family MFS transporter n=1 Tax=Polymorphobacter sp. TaxID=1909290 RepID=UPI003F71E3CD